MRRKILAGAVIALLLSVAAINVRGQGGKAVRQAWEYKTLVLNIQGMGATTLYEDGNVVRGATPVSRAPDLGNQGWELVSVTGVVMGVPPAQVTQFVYWFKRPK